MTLRFFAVPVRDSSTFEQQVNGFLASHKVVSINRRLIDQGTNSFWAICVDYLSHAPGETNRNPNLSRNRIDYKTVLPPVEFEVFSRSAALRRVCAGRPAVGIQTVRCQANRRRSGVSGLSPLADSRGAEST
jgi:hypothetical protein